MQMPKSDWQFTTVSVVFIANRTFLVRFGGISDEFGRAMVRISARRSQAKIPMARPNEPDGQKCTIRYLPYPNSAQNLAFSSVT